MEELLRMRRGREFQVVGAATAGGSVHIWNPHYQKVTGSGPRQDLCHCNSVFSVFWSEEVQTPASPVQNKNVKVIRE